MRRDDDEDITVNTLNTKLNGHITHTHRRFDDIEGVLEKNNNAVSLLSEKFTIHDEKEVIYRERRDAIDNSLSTSMEVLAHTIDAFKEEFHKYRDTMKPAETTITFIGALKSIFLWVSAIIGGSYALVQAFNINLFK